MDFAAIDFETANEQSSSACQLGVVVVAGGSELASHRWMIKPRPLRFSSHCIAVHGITPRQVAREAEFGQLWAEISEVLRDKVLVAHNAGFDMGVLRSCLLAHGLTIPDMQFTCTRLIARRTWPRHTGFGLRAIADRLGIDFRHHDALEDARACAKVLLAAADRCGESSLDRLERRLGLSRGRAGQWGCGGPRMLNSETRDTAARWTRRQANRRAVDLVSPANAQIYQERLAFREDGSVAKVHVVEHMEKWKRRATELAGFAGKKVVLTGQLTKLEREDAAILVTLAGGQVCSGVSRKTTVLVVGQPDARTQSAGRVVSTKEEKVRQLQEEGCQITVLNEPAFLMQLLGPEASAG